MWCEQLMCRGLVLVLSWSVVAPSVEALTTFGKSQTNAPKDAAPTPPPARPCRRQSECAGIAGTSCVRTAYDVTTRCRCGDNLPPLNGHCDAPNKALFHVCSGSEECADGLACAAPNATRASPSPAPAPAPAPATPPHLRVHAPADTLCLCDVDNGFVERDFACSDADILTTSVFAIAIVTLLRTATY